MFRKDCAAVPGSDASVYQRVLGSAFDDLDEQLRTYFGPIPAGFVGIGVGRFAEAGLRLRALRPLFAILGLRRIAFAEHEVDVPFAVRNVPGPQGTLNATRTFHFAAATRQMTDAMSVVDGKLVDRIGTGGHIEIELSAKTCDGRLHLESSRLSLRVLGRRWPLPQIVRVRLREEIDARDGRVQRVALRITTPGLGLIYGYHGDFTYTLEPVASSDAIGSVGEKFLRHRDAYERSR